MASSSSSPLRLTSSPNEASRSPSPPKTSLGKRRASFLDKSIELKQKSLLLSSAGLTSSLGLTLPSSVGVSPPSPRILLRPEVAAYLARGLSQFHEQMQKKSFWWRNTCICNNVVMSTCCLVILQSKLYSQLIIPYFSASDNVGSTRVLASSGSGSLNSASGSPPRPLLQTQLWQSACSASPLVSKLWPRTDALSLQALPKPGHGRRQYALWLLAIAPFHHPKSSASTDLKPQNVSHPSKQFRTRLS